MSEIGQPPPLIPDWTDEARAELRTIRREAAMQILYCLTRFIRNRTGDVKKLKPPRTEFRLRCGGYRVFFLHTGTNIITITGVDDRKDAYR